MLLKLEEIKKHLRLTDAIATELIIDDSEIKRLSGSFLGKINVGDILQLEGFLKETNSKHDLTVTEVAEKAIKVDRTLEDEVYALWEAGGEYEVEDIVYNDGKLYECLEDHTASSAFATDLTAEKWELASLEVVIRVITHDDFLEDQIAVFSSAIETYCNRRFNVESYEQDFYSDQYEGRLREIVLYHYPVVELTSITNTDNESVFAETEYRVNKPSGKIIKVENGIRSNWFQDTNAIKVEYDAGFEEIPILIKTVMKRLITQEFNKAQATTAHHIGADIQSMSVAGVMSLSFDTSLYASNRKYRLGEILGNNTTILDSFRSSRVILPPPEDVYVQ